VLQRLLKWRGHRADGTTSGSRRRHAILGEFEPAPRLGDIKPEPRQQTTPDLLS